MADHGYHLLVAGLASARESHRSATIPDIRLRFEMPAAWQRLDPKWAWTPDADSGMEIGVNWSYLEPPLEMEAALYCPNPRRFCTPSR